MQGRSRVSEGSSRFRTSEACITVMNALQRNAMPADAFVANDTRRLQCLMADLMDDVVHHVVGTLDHVDEGNQEPSVTSAGLLDDGGRLTRSAGDDMARF